MLPGFESQVHPAVQAGNFLHLSGEKDLDLSHSQTEDSHLVLKVP